MDSDGVIVDGGRAPEDIKDEEVLQWYRNMLTGAYLTLAMMLSSTSIP